MNKTGLILFLSAVAVCCLALENEETCQTRDILRQFDQLANKTVPDIADQSIQKLEKSLNDLYGKVETIIKPLETKQEQIVQKIEQESLTNETVIEIVEKSMDKLFEKVETLIAAKPPPESIKNESSTQIPTELAQLVNETVTDIVDKSMDNLFEKVKTLIKNSHTLGISSAHPATSCKEILEQNKGNPSSYYWLIDPNGNTVQVYCDMTRTCGGVTGGWMRVAQLDTTKNPQYCPNPLSLNTQHGKNLCARRETAAGCSQVRYQTNSVAYNEVCGKVIGYQFGSTDGPVNYSAGINGAYIDGVSLTHGSPRQHIWSFITALHESGISSPHTCHCSNRNHRGSLPASFVGTDYFCDTGSRNPWQFIFYSNDPLWDGAGCGSNSECCTFQNPPWFYKKLGASTSNNIDMRVCRDEAAANEDVLIEKVDIFVR